MVDIGNTTVKAAVFAGKEKVDYKREDGQDVSILKEMVDKYDIDRCIISSTANIEEHTTQEINNLGCDIEYLTSKTSLFAMQPETVILNRDDANYSEFSKFAGTKQTLTYGHDDDCSLVITNSQLYKKGTEASLTYGRKDFTVASFLTGEPSISYMAAAAAIACALHVSIVMGCFW